MDLPAFLPSRVAERFARACEGEASVGWSEQPKLVSLQSAGLLTVARQVEGFMPAVWRTFMDADEWYPCETAELTRAVRMASLAAEHDRIELAFTEGEVTVSAGGACQVIPCGYQGPDAARAVGGKNLLAGLNGCGEQVNLSFARKPLLLDSEGLRWLVQTRDEISSA